MAQISPRYFLKFTALLLALYSIALLCLPLQVMHLLAIAPSDAGVMFMRFLGASLAAHAYLNWHTAGLDQAAVRLIIHVNMLALGLAVGIGLLALVTGSATGWTIILLGMHFVFLVGFGAVLSISSDS